MKSSISSRTAASDICYSQIDGEVYILHFPSVRYLQARRHEILKEYARFVEKSALRDISRALPKEVQRMQEQDNLTPSSPVLTFLQGTSGLFASRWPRALEEE